LVHDYSSAVSLLAGLQVSRLHVAVMICDTLVTTETQADSVRPVILLAQPAG